MSEPKFTPGPWKWTFEEEDGFPYIYASSESMPVLMNLCAPDGKQKEMIANANLVAAAPEMYEVLTRIKREMECDENWYIVINDVEDVLEHARGEK